MQQWQLAVVPNGQWYIGSIVGHRWLDTRQMFRLDPLFHRHQTCLQQGHREGFFPPEYLVGVLDVVSVDAMHGHLM